MNDKRLRTCINLFSSFNHTEDYLDSIIAMLIFARDTHINDASIELLKNEVTVGGKINRLSYLRNQIPNKRDAQADEIQKMLISLSALFISLHKEEIVDKDQFKKVTLKVNEIDYNDIITFIASKQNNKYYITNIEFDTSAECIDFVRNKLLHGDYHIKDERIYFEKDNQEGSISFQRLIDFCIYLNKLSHCKNKEYKDGIVLLSPFKLGYDNTNSLASRLFEVNVTIKVKGKRKISYKIINLMEQILETAQILNVERGYFVGEAVEEAIAMYSEELNENHCTFEFTSAPFVKNPNARSVIERLKNEIKFFKTENTLTDADCLNFITTHTFNEPVKTLDECFLGLSRFLLKFMPNATNGKVEPDVDLSNFNYTYCIKLPMNILKFYCYFNYGLDAIFSSGRNTDLRDIAQGRNFDYSIMDLSKFDDPNMTREFKLSGYNDQLTKLQKEQSLLSVSYQKQINNYNNFLAKNINNPAAEQKMLSSIQTTQTALNLKTKELTNATNLDVSKYEKNLDIINHLRNSIAHGHYKIDDSNPNDLYYEFSDIYNGVTTYHIRISVKDFEKIFDYKPEITKYIESLAKTELNKSIDRIHYEDILLDSSYVLDTELSKWNNLVETTLDNNDPKEIDHLLLLFEIMREITLSSLYAKDLKKVERATIASFHNFIIYTPFKHDEGEILNINGHKLTEEEYKQVIELLIQYSKSYYEYDYDKLIMEYVKDAEEGSILSDIFKGKTL